MALLFGVARSSQAALDAHRGHAARVPGRPGRPRADRRARPGVLRAAGHAHAGRSRRSSPWSSTRPSRSSSSVRSGCRASPWRSPSPPGSRRWPCSLILDHRLPDFRATGLIGVGLASIAATVVASAVGVGTLTVLQSALGGASRAGSSCSSQIAVVSAVFAAVYRRSAALALRIPELPLYRRGHGRRRSAARAGRDGERRRRRGAGTRSSRRATPARTSSSPPGRASRRSTAGRRTACRRATAPARVGAQVLVRRPRPMPWGFAYAPRGPVGGRLVRGRRSSAFTEAVRDGLPRDRRARLSHLRIDPEIEADGPLDPDGALRTALRAAGWRPAAPIQPASTRIIDLRADEAALWGDLRKKWRQYVNKARSGGDRGRRRRGRPAGRVLPDLPRDGGPGRLPDPDRGRLSRRLGGVPARRPRPAAVRPDARRRAAGRRSSSCAAARGWWSRTAA